MRESAQSFTGSSSIVYFTGDLPAITGDSLLHDRLNQRKSTTKHFLEGARLSQLVRLFGHKQTNYYASDHPNQSIKLSEAQAVSLLIPILFFPNEAFRRSLERRFSPLKIIKESFLGGNVISVP